jgi:hypothetical protein
MSFRQAVVEVVCGCDNWWMRWTAELGAPFDSNAVTAWANGRPFRLEDPGGYRRGSDGKWYRWAPGPARDMPEGEIWGRYVFECPGCGSNVQARTDKLEDAAVHALRGLHASDMTTPLRLTVDKLLRWAAGSVP